MIVVVSGVDRRGVRQFCEGGSSRLSLHGPREGNPRAASVSAGVIGGAVIPYYSRSE